MSQHIGSAVIAWAAGTPSILWDDSGLIDSVLDNGVGDVTLNLHSGGEDSSGVAADDELSITVTPRSGATFAQATIQGVSDTAKRLRTFNAAGAAVDNIPLSLTFFKRERN